MQEQTSEFTPRDERAIDTLYIVAGVGWGIAIFAVGFALGVMR